MINLLPLSYHVALWISAWTYCPVVPTHSDTFDHVVPPSVVLSVLKLPTITLLAFDWSMPKPMQYQAWDEVALPFKSVIFVDVKIFDAQVTPPSVDLKITVMTAPLLLGAAYSVLPEQASSSRQFAPEGNVKGVVADVHVADVTVLGLSVKR